MASTASASVMGRIVMIVNPAGRDGTVGRRWPHIHEQVRAAGLNPEVHQTERVGHATEIAASLRNDSEVGMVVAVGGDGTVHEIASGIRGTSIPLGIIPLGSGSDYARSHGIPLKDTDTAISLLSDGIDRRVGAIRLEGRPAPPTATYPSPTQREVDGRPEKEGNVVRWVFLESDCGVTSQVSRMKTEGRFKRIRGSLKYTLLGIRAVLGWKRQMAWVRVDDGDGEIVDMSGLFVMCMAETFGGGYRVAPGMVATEERASLIRAFGLSKIRMLALMGPLRKGKHVGKWGITHQRATRIEVRAVDEDGKPTDSSHSPSIWIQSDGEPCLQTPATLVHHGNQLTVRGGPVLLNG